MNNEFIITTDKDSADYLINQGLHMVSHCSNQWIFYNEDRMVFSNLKKVTYTNKIFM